MNIQPTAPVSAPVSAPLNLPVRERMNRMREARIDLSQAEALLDLQVLALAEANQSLEVRFAAASRADEIAGALLVPASDRPSLAQLEDLLWEQIHRVIVPEVVAPGLMSRPHTFRREETRAYRPYEGQSWAPFEVLALYLTGTFVFESGEVTVPVIASF